MKTNSSPQTGCETSTPARPSTSGASSMSQRTMFGDSSGATSSAGSAGGKSLSVSPAGKAKSGPAVAPARPSRQQDKRNAALRVADVLSRALDGLDISSASNASTPGTPTDGTSGPSSGASSATVDLQRSLASRLRRRMDGYGSLEYELRWNELATPLGPPILQRRALVRRTSGSDCSGWPTTRATDGEKGIRSSEGAIAEFNRKGTGADLPSLAATAGWPTPDASAMNVGCDPEIHLARLERLKAKGINGNGAGLTLGAAASMSGWPTPAVQNSDGGPNPNWNTGEHFTLQTAAGLAGWPTPCVPCGGQGLPTEVEFRGGTAYTNGRKVQLKLHHVAGWGYPASRDWKDTPGMATTGVNHDGTTRERLDQLPRQAGLTSNSSPVEAGNRGVLNPAFSLWLMGLSSELLMAAPVTIRRDRVYSKRSGTALSRR